MRLPITGYDKEDKVPSTNVQHLSWLLPYSAKISRV